MISNYFTPGYKIKTASNTPDGGGGIVVSYSIAATIPGRMRMLNGNEIIQNEKKSLVTTHRFYCDYTNVITATSKIEAPDGSIYEVKLINNPMEFNEFLQIDCELKR